MNIKIEITLTNDDYTEEAREIQVQIQEFIPGGFQNLDKWEGNVRKIGFQTMREVFNLGIGVYEKNLLSEYTHRGKECHTVKRGKLNFTLATVFGKVTFQRQRVFCKTCRKWVTPLNEALGFHEEDKERTTLALQQLSSLYAVNQPYRQAEKAVADITQDTEAISHQQIKLIVDQEGDRLRQYEEQKRKDISYDVIREIVDELRTPQSRSPTCSARFPPKHPGRFYICLDGIMVRSHVGKGKWHEGKVGFLCTDERKPVGKKGRLRIPNKRYISSYENSAVFGSRVYAEAVKMGMRDYVEVILLGDGARWIRAVRIQCFPYAIYVLDWYHLHRKVCRAFRYTFPKDRTLRRKLRKPITTQLWKGQKEEALKSLKELYAQLLSEGKQDLLDKREGMKELTEYIQNNWEGVVNYDQMQKDGYLIASTLVESAANLVVAKRQKKKQGMHWSRSGADNLCALRTLWLNENWEGYWAQRRRKSA
ncbi:ISKra4 family transposase [Candidatus Poribacteria bacterium]